MPDSGQMIADRRIIDLARRFDDLSERLDALDRQGLWEAEAGEAAWSELDQVIAELERAEPSTPAGVAAQARALRRLRERVGEETLMHCFSPLVQALITNAARLEPAAD